ncbi:hypothetical protein ACROYT_G006798 [Oculina patagonica]
MEESGDEDPGGKRAHIPTGNTPHKPDDKRRRSTGSLPVRGKSVKKLAFPRSPGNIVKKSPLTRRKPVFSPLKELRPEKKKRKPWTTPEDSALVQFIANFQPNHIDQSIPAFHRELLIAWTKLQPHVSRDPLPASLIDILAEPLFLNPNITSLDNTLLFRHWITSGVTQVRDICYLAIPGLLPARAICELLPDTPPEQVLRELQTIQAALPDAWSRLISTQCTFHRATTPVTFIVNTPRTPLANLTTRLWVPEP